MDLSTAFRLPEVDCRDLALRMRKPWYRYLDRNEEWKEWVIILYKLNDDAFAEPTSTADKFHCASNLISSSYSYRSPLDGPIHLCKFMYAHLMTQKPILSRFGMRNPRIMWSVSESLT